MGAKLLKQLSVLCPLNSRGFQGDRRQTVLRGVVGQVGASDALNAEGGGAHAFRDDTAGDAAAAIGSRGAAAV